MPDWPIPEGYRIEETRERVLGSRPVVRCRGLGAKRRAMRAIRDYNPSLPSYRLAAERVGPLAWDVVAYQNRLVPQGE